MPKTIQIDTLKTNERNPRKITPARLELLKQSITDFEKMLTLRPIVVDELNVCLGGNMRLAALKALGYTDLPAAWIKRADDLTADEKRQFIIKDNADFGDWDLEILAEDWNDVEDLAAWGLDLPKGFGDDGEIIDAEPQTDKAAELNKKWKVAPGDLWQIGEHRLLCGDSTNAADVERVTGGEKMELCLTDPPYGIGWNTDYTRFTSEYKEQTKYPKIKNDDSEIFNPIPFLNFEKVILWGANWYCKNIPLGSWLVWDKRHASGAALLSDAEIAWMKGGTGVYLYAETVQGAHRSEVSSHPTQKPVGLFKWCIEKAKTEGNIYEPFAGSGTTLVACQNLNRKCYSIEISANYCAVILERMKTAFPEIEIKKL